MIEIRRVFTQVEEIFHDFGPPLQAPRQRGAVCAVLTNPFAGRYEPNIMPMMEALNPVGIDMTRRLLAAMRVAREQIEGYGKGAIVGSDGEIEHGAHRTALARHLHRRPELVEELFHLREHSPYLDHSAQSLSNVFLSAAHQPHPALQPERCAVYQSARDELLGAPHTAGERLLHRIGR